MRWEGQQLGTADGAALPGLQRIAGLVRSVRTPEFEGITFHEVTCKSALNKVPAASAVPFRWTINPYRGCSHACVYCLSGDTLILMADGRVKPIAEVRPGDQIYGTRHAGKYRRYVRTVVLDHWQTVKPAFRVELEDGTAIVASGDHRFLTGQGWKHVTDAASRTAGGRAHLTTRDELLGMGGTTVSLEASDDYRLGYLTGMIRGEARVESDARLRVVAVRPLGVELPMFDISTGTGDFIANGVVSHNCFARGTHTYLDLDPGEDFNRQVVVKVNLAEVVRREVAKASWSREHVAMGTNTDPYQRAEGRYRLMPGVIEALAGSGTPFSILTKGTLLRRDLPLLAEAARAVDVGVGVSLAILDDDLQKSVEPGTPTPKARLELIRAIRDAGLPCGVLVAPVLPGLTDSVEHLDSLIAAVSEAGATGVTVIPLHLRPGAREWYLRWLTQEHPHLVSTYQRLYGRGTYADTRYRAELHERVAPLLRRHGIEDRAERGPEGRLRPPEGSESSSHAAAPPVSAQQPQEALF